MAEARRQAEEEELRDGRDTRNRSRNQHQPTERSERNKPEHFHSSSGTGSCSQTTGVRGPPYPSQGPLSSVRAAIKRTRTNTQCDHARDRRRPEITILSAEPLASTAWFPGASGGFPPPPPPAQQTWSGSIQPAAQPPPSYDQVIKEKTQEHVTTPTAAPRRSVTIATQTDPVEEEDAPAAGPECTAAPQPIKKTVKKPQKPPRPSLPKPLQSDWTAETSGPNPADTTATTTTDTENHTDTTATTPTDTENHTDTTATTPTDTENHTDPQSAANTKNQTDPQSAANTENHTDPQSAANTENQTDPQSATNTENHTDPQSAANTENHTDPQSAANTENQTDPQSATVQPSHPETSCTISYSPSPSVTVTVPLPEPSSTTAPSVPSEPTVPSSTESVPTQRPTPLPRLKSLKQLIPEEVKVQTLVRFSDNGDIAEVTTPSGTAAPPSGTYLQDLLDVFCSDGQWDQSCDVGSDQSDRSDQSEDGGGSDSGEMSALHSQRNIRARIQALERQASIDRAECPEPLPRNAPNPKPPVVAAKPALAPRPLSNPTPAPRPQLPRKPVEPPPPKEEPEVPPTKTAILPPSRSSVLARAKSFLPLEAEGPAVPQAGPPTPQEKPRKEPLNLNNHNSVSVSTETEAENEYVDNPAKPTPAKPLRVGGSGGSFSRQSVARRPTTIRVPSKAKLFEESQDSPPPLPSQKPVGALPPPVTRKPSLTPSLPPRPSQNSIHSEPEPSLPPRPSGVKVLPPRPPSVKAGPGRPPPPRLDGPHRPPSVHGAPGGVSLKQAQGQKPKRKGPVLPPRPNPGHRLYNKYTLELPHGIAEFDYNGSHTGELSFQKNEVLLLLEQVDHKTFECQVGDTRGPVQKTRMKVITPLSSSVPNKPSPQGTSPSGSRKDSSGLQVYAVYDFNSEGPGELSLRVGDVVTMVEQVDSDWYRGSCNGSSGCFPVNYVKVMTNAPTPTRTPTPTNVKKARPPPATVSGPRGVARFDFEGEHSDELSFSEGDVIQLREYLGQEWARGQLGDYTGIFPINFVDVIEDLPPPPAQKQTAPTKVALPGMVASPSTKNREAAKSVKPPSPGGEEWVVALYAFTGQTEEDLTFQQGDCILVKEHIDSDWCSGRLNGKQGFFPKAFVEPSSGQSAGWDAEQGAGTETEGGRAKALFEFTSECEEELSLKVGDVLTNLESIDDEWFLADLKGKRAMVPKNYVQVLA